VEKKKLFCFQREKREVIPKKKKKWRSRPGPLEKKSNEKILKL